MPKTVTITIPAVRYEDSDECLQDAAQDTADALDLESWECTAAWGKDRETILVTVPAPLIAGYRVYRADIDGSEAVPVVADGTDRETIEAVEMLCEEWCSIECTADA